MRDLTPRKNKSGANSKPKQSRAGQSQRARTAKPVPKRANPAAVKPARARGGKRAPARRTRATAAVKQLTLTEALDSLQEGLALFDAEDRLVACNEPYRRLFPSIAELIVPGVASGIPCSIAFCL